MIYALVALGGAIGAALRWSIDVAIPSGAGGVAWEIVAINVVGSAALGTIVGWAEHRGEPSWYPAVGPGLLGGFTTYSAAAAADLATGANSTAAIATLVATLLVAVPAAGAGWALAQRGRVPEPVPVDSEASA
jgi:CrcB protein